MAAEGTPAYKTLRDIVLVTKNARMPLHELVPKLTPLSRDVIFKSGTGVEGFLRLHPDCVSITVEGGTKFAQPADGALQLLFGSEKQSPPTPSESSTAAPTPRAAATDAGATAAAASGGVVVPVPPTHPAYRLVVRLKQVASEDGAWYNINEVYNRVYSTDEAKQSVKHRDFVAFLKSMPEAFWVTKAALRFRAPGENTMPEVTEVLTPGKKRAAAAAPGTSSAPAHANPAAATAATPQGTAAATSSTAATPAGFQGVVVASATNNYGGWGSLSNIPTPEDVFEILKYIPIQWTNLGNIGVPPDIKKKHVRIASFLQWLRRQPKYFEVRNLAGTMEVRRAITLHPESHGMTKEQAEEIVAKRIAEGIHNSIQSTTPENSVGSTASAASSAVHKFLARVCPGYFVPMEMVLNRRATKKSMSREDLFRAAIESPDVFEELTLRDGSKLVRRRIGYDSSKWLTAFAEDVNAAENIPLLLSVMTKAPPLWDRLPYLYVRLSDEDKTAVGGYEGLVAMLKRHPTVFRAGEHFYRRIDSSDPASADEPEPTSNDAQAAKICEENPYLTPKELALVYHYLTPEEGSTTVSYFVEASSPAMRVVLPPRPVTMLQTFPDMFLCKEVSPGMFSVQRRKVGAGVEEEVGMKPEEAVEGVAALIPVRGVDAAQLQVWMSMQLKNAATAHFGSLLELVRRHPDKFHVVENPPYTMIYKHRSASTPSASAGSPPNSGKV